MDIGRLSTIATIQLAPPATRSAHRRRYRVTLSCGCSWWEDHDITDDLPAPGDKRICHATHFDSGGVDPRRLHRLHRDSTSRDKSL